MPISTPRRTGVKYSPAASPPSNLDIPALSPVSARPSTPDVVVVSTSGVGITTTTTDRVVVAPVKGTDTDTTTIDTKGKRSSTRRRSLLAALLGGRSAKTVLHAALCALSVITSLCIYSILQERIMTRPYTYNGKAAFFTHSLVLVLANRVFAVFTAVAVALMRGDVRKQLATKAPYYAYALPSVSNVIATSCQYEALKWLTFPTVTIGKCAKMLPVMLILNLRQRYARYNTNSNYSSTTNKYNNGDFAIAGIVILGCTIMVRAGKFAVPSPKQHTDGPDEDTLSGFILMAAYLLFDAITSTSQQGLFEKYDTSVSNQMLFINISSSIISALSLLVGGGAVQAFYFIAQFPHIAKDIVTLSAAAVAGQFAISHTIHKFGALLYAGIMTSRQFASVLISDFLFDHGLNAGQWTGALLVFGALFFKVFKKAAGKTANSDQ